MTPNRYLLLQDKKLLVNSPSVFSILGYLNGFDKDICWIFGDSFMDTPANYILHYLEKYNKRGIILSRGGTGVDYSYLRFLEVEKYIKPYHSMLVGISAVSRFYWNDYHINSTGKIRPKNNNQEPTSRFKKAVELFFLELYNDEDQIQLKSAIVDTFVRRVRDRVEKAIIIPTIHPYDVLGNIPSMMSILSQWYKDDTLPPGNNHWPDDRQFSDNFYKYYDSTFEVWS